MVFVPDELCDRTSLERTFAVAFPDQLAERLFHRIQRFEIAYVAESYPGDCLHFYKEESSLDEFCIRITKGNVNETEVVRSKVKFVNI